MGDEAAASTLPGGAGEGTPRTTGADPAASTTGNETPSSPPPPGTVSTADGRTLFERIGGEAQVERLVAAHYRRVLDDPELRPFFAHTDLEKLRRMQREFLSTALGGPSTYTGRPLAHVHQGRGITKRHFTRFVEHLLTSLESLGLDKDDVYAVIDRVAVQADEITGGFGEDG